MKKKNTLFQPVHITKHGGKMEGIPSISTSKLLNPLCEQHAKNLDSICAHCYAGGYLEYRENLRNALARNTGLLTTAVLPDYQLPSVNSILFRFESFGDLMTVEQVVNYFNICRKNQVTRFALWTKNLQFIALAIKQGHEKPKNLNIVYSSPLLDTPIEPAYVEKLFPFVDVIFTVYSSEQAAAKHGAVINCGKNICQQCRICYTPHDGIVIVSELLKGKKKSKKAAKK